VEFKDIVEGVTMKEEVDEVTGFARQVVLESPDEKHQPQSPHPPDKKILRRYLLPSRALLMVSTRGGSTRHHPGQDPPGDHQDQGHHRRPPPVVELFEARRPKEPASSPRWTGSSSTASGRRGCGRSSSSPTRVTATST